MVQKNNINNKIIIICGPTASGKSDLAIECAKLLNTEIISADSMYIYKGLDIGTAKPSIKETQGVKHHLIDVACPFDTFSVSDYKKLAQPIIDDLISKGKIPIICGGTGFYINSILYDFSYGKSSANLEVRNSLKALAEEKGNEFIYNKLVDVDPESAQKLHYNDLKRVVRALEIFYSGTKKSAQNDEIKPKYDYYAYSIGHSRQTLYDRINYRVDKMIELGLIDEIKSLLSLGVNKDNQCMQAIGYKEILEHLSGYCTLDEAIEKIKLNTRHYAKRQITFFKKLIHTELEPQDPKELAKVVIEGLNYDK